jgi:hypothetical protein
MGLTAREMAAKPKQLKCACGAPIPSGDYCASCADRWRRASALNKRLKQDYPGTWSDMDPRDFIIWYYRQKYKAQE